MTETKQAEQTAVTLDLTPQPIHAPATVEAPSTTAAAGGAAAPSRMLGADSGPLDRIEDMLRRGISFDDLDRFLAMQKKWEDEQAHKAYLRAMAAWKADGVPAIPKNVHVEFMGAKGPVSYWHEDLADVVAAVLPLMAAVGLSHSWRPVQEGRGENMLITVETVVTHTAGHSERVALYAAPDPSGGKNSIQAVKSSITYLERIGLLAILGIAAKGHDNDGRGAVPIQYREPGSDDDRGGGDGASSPSSARAPGKPHTTPPQETAPRAGVVSEKQVGLLGVRLRERGIDQASFCDVYGIPALEDLPRDRMDEALKWIGSQR